MLVYRLSKRKYASDLTGAGARRYGGRWNQAGTAIIYTSETRALAALEVLVHLNKTEAQMPFVITTFDIGDSVKTISPKELPAEWQETESSHLLFEITNNWILNQQSVGLKVPSVIMPSECNVLLNPDHPKFRSIKIVEQEEYSFDKRFFYI